MDENLFSDATFPTSLEAGGFDIALFSWIGSPFQSQSAGLYQSLEASGGLLAQNYTRGGNAEVDALYEEFFREPDLDAQAELGNQIDALLWEDLYRSRSTSSRSSWPTPPTSKGWSSTVAKRSALEQPDMDAE